MTSSTWSDLSDAPSTSLVRRGPVAMPAVIASPSGGGPFVYGFASSAPAGFAGLAFVPGIAETAFFAPLARGGGIAAVFARIKGDVAPLLFVCLQGNDSQQLAYLLGLSASGRLVLRKGTPADGLPDVAPGEQGVIARSDAVVALKSWVHLKLEIATNPNGDAIVNAFANDLTRNPLDAPIWTEIPGFPPADERGSQFVDDALGINSGSLPLSGGGLGYGVKLESAGAAAFAAVGAPTAQI